MSRSSFPDSLDTFTELFDLPYDKIGNAKRLTELKMQSALTNDEQNELLNLTSSLNEYMITPETMNKFSDALYAVENFFINNVQGFINNKQTIWDSYIKQFKYVGSWSSGKAYKFQNIVSDSNGDLQICQSNHTSTSANNPVSNQTIWAKASSKGDTGPIGLNATYKGDWTTTGSYILGDAVYYGREGSNQPLTFIAMKANTGKTPKDNPDVWQLYNQLYVGTSEHPGASNGMHFLHVTG
ncbi:hypothetical protein [Enterococcus sp. N249-2]